MFFRAPSPLVFILSTLPLGIHILSDLDSSILSDHLLSSYQIKSKHLATPSSALRNWALFVRTPETSLHASTTATFPITTRIHASIMVSRRNRTLASLSLFLAVWVWNASAAAVKGETAVVDAGALTSPQIEEQLQVINPCCAQYNIKCVLTPLRIRTALLCKLSMLTGSFEPDRLEPHVSDICFPVSWYPRRQRPPRDLVHLRTTQLPTRTMSRQT